MSGATVSHPHALRLFEHRVNGWLVVAVQGQVGAGSRDEAAAQLTVRLRSVTRRGRDAVAVDLTALGTGTPAEALLAQARELIVAGRSVAVVVPGSGEPSTLDGDVLRVAALAELPPVAAPRFGRWS